MSEIVNRDFEFFMSMSFPTVGKNSDQWTIMEMVWNSAAMSTSIHLTENPKDLEKIFSEAYDYGVRMHRKLFGKDVPRTDGINELN